MLDLHGPMYGLTWQGCYRSMEGIGLLYIHLDTTVMGRAFGNPEREKLESTAAVIHRHLVAILSKYAVEAQMLCNERILIWQRDVAVLYSGMMDSEEERKD